ncbi:DNA polymerase III subunit gamma/tau [uncultured Campylobacter sp.]|uniref:DNA polymerase III subunit gamma/tau n=1 Tax=uncultured Campylobacter sp. TaxID=218934 RepID=UPI0026253D06|nr:DNA polymerase III subunit gamma/tau [uncultured Campylobacter sp.]
MQALALKYRPKSFEQLIGQDAVAKSLAHALDSGRLSHAYLFSGLRGSGKTSTARIFAKALLCDKGPTGKPCEVCDNCVMANEGRHIDIIEMDAASHRKIDDIRELIEQTKYHPASARFKIFIIDEVHMLTKEASNALLKTLEEPPSYVKFILATTDPLKLPVTVLSRTQHFRFKPIAKSAVVAHLEQILKTEKIAYEEGALEILARSGSGSLRDTLTLLDQAIIFSREGITQRAIADMLGLLDPAKIGEILDVVLRQDRAGAIEIIKEVENYNAETIIDEMIANLKDKFLRRDAKFSLLMYERFFRILAGAKSMLAISPDNTYAISMMIFMMMEAVNLREIDELIEVGRSLDQGEGYPSASAPNLNAQSSAPNFRSNSNQSANFSPNSEPGGATFSPSGQSSATSGVPSFTTSAKRPANTAQNSGASGAVKQNLDAGGEIKPGVAAQAQNSNSSVQTGAQNEIYENFLAKIYDRDYDLGEKFSKCVEFLKFERGTLYLLSRAQGQDREYLRKGSRAINSVLKSLFGESAAIKIEQSAPHKQENFAPSGAENSAPSSKDSVEKGKAKSATSSTERPLENSSGTTSGAQNSDLGASRTANSEQDEISNDSENYEENFVPKAAKPKKNGASGEGEKQPPKDDLLRSTDPQNYAAKPRDTSKSVRAAKAGLAELANGAQDGKEILISEMNRLFGEPTKITE